MLFEEVGWEFGDYRRPGCPPEERAALPRGQTSAARSRRSAGGRRGGAGRCGAARAGRGGRSARGQPRPPLCSRGAEQPIGARPSADRPLPPGARRLRPHKAGGSDAELSSCGAACSPSPPSRTGPRPGAWAAGHCCCGGAPRPQGECCLLSF